MGRLGGSLLDCIVNEMLIEGSVEACVNGELLNGWLLAFVSAKKASMNDLEVEKAASAAFSVMLWMKLR